MLDSNTKRRIDDARDILVGKVPDPKSQVEQITIALIYKFMDDIDAQSEEWGGDRSFFAGEFARYGWTKLMSTGLGGHERLNLYAESIARMPENPGVPQLFRAIFNNAFLPYRDPETLTAFLKVIDQFDYDTGDPQGDAFEYLLQVMGAQGDAGQFRTPRHVIDFIVRIVDPQKHETILDPACGTAGFLISAYNHIGKANVDERGINTLSPDDVKRMFANITGYDISPDMVRLSLANMYLHGFPDPHVYEYDTLTSEDRWNERANVILANPPFMSPKGGIRPHNRFGVQSKRSEVLFVDYIAEHLTPGGRAGVIVPEGVIFQSQNAYKQLRKMLVDDYLAAVISLPAGVFNPYSGVKTSILILDTAIARKSDSIAFCKVENDGYDLGAQRRPIDANDLPNVQRELSAYLRAARAGEPTDAASLSSSLIVDKQRIAADGEYNLSAERYRESARMDASFPYVPLGQVARVASGNPAPQDDHYFDGGELPFIRTSDVGAVHRSDNFIGSADKVNQTAVDELRLRLFPTGTILFPKSGASTFLNHRVHIGEPAYVSSHLACIVCDEEKALSKYVYYLLCHVDARQITPDQAYPSLKLSRIENIEIPLPPLDVQREIVEEVEGYQRVIDGARAVVENWRPRVWVDPSWEMVELGEKGVFRVVSGGTPKSSVPEFWDGGVPWITLVDLPPDDIITEITATERTISEEGLQSSSAVMIPANSVVVSSRATIGRIGINRVALATNQGFKNVVIEDRTRAIPEYVALALTRLTSTMEAQASGSTYKEIIKSRFARLKIPMPPLDVQRAVVEEIDAERAMVSANRELAARMEGRVREAVGRVWGDDGGVNG